MRRLFFILTFLCCLAIALTAQTTRESISSNPAEVLNSTRTETVQVGSGRNSVQVISSSDAETVLHFQVNQFTKTKVEIDGKDWYDVRLHKEGITLDEGFPQLPVFNRSVIVGDNALMKLEIFDVEYQDIKLPIAPSKGDLLRNVDPATVPYVFDKMYQVDAFYPESIATLSEPYIMRDFRGIVVRTKPFAYNPISQTLRVYTSYKVRVFADGNDTVNILTTSRTEISRSFVEVYENHFLNWENYRYTSIYDGFGKFLIIYEDDFEDEITPFFEWKRQKGITGYFVAFSNVGTTASQLQTFIQSYYTSSSVDFVILVGDAVHIPTLSVGGGGSDPSFALVSGTDNYPDLFISRISASNGTDVTTQVNKILTYERDFTTAQTWIQWASGIASDQGPGDDGEYDYEHMNLIRSDLIGYGYTIVDQIYDPGATASQVSSVINGGSSLINYCGHGGTYSLTTTGFDTGDVAALTNGVKTPIVCSVACLNGNFVSYTCLAEAFQRKSGGGSIAFYGSSINQSWSPPMAGQDEVNDLLVAESKKTIGGLFFNGACKMLDDYPTAGDMYKTWNIFGDCSMLARTKNPQAMTVTHTNVINPGASSAVTVNTGVPYSYVGITVGTTVYAYGYANVSGVFTTTLSPGTFMTYTITVTAFNRVTYVGNIYSGYVWDGSTSTVWGTASNWNCGFVPSSGFDVKIPAGMPRYPTTSSAIAYCNNLTVENGASVTVSTYDLRVSGDVKFYGQLNISAATDLEVDGDIYWYSGSTANMTHSTAEIYCGDNMIFYSGSDVQFDLGYIEFDGTGSSYITNYSSNTEFNNLRSDITDGSAMIFDSASTQDFVINGSIWNYDNRKTFCYYTGNIILKGNLNDYNTTATYGVMWFYGTLIMDGTSQNLNLQGPACYVNNLTVSSSATVTLQQDIDVRGNLRIESGVLSAGSHIITLDGNWENVVGTAAFSEGTSRVIFNGSGHQYCNYTETFNIVEIDKSGGALRVNNAAATVTCASYDWTLGALDVLVGTFTANDLADNGLYGSYYVNPGATINLHQGTDQYIDLNGNLIFSSGGTINVYGGSSTSWWPYAGNASITMSGGTLDFKDKGIYVTTASYSFTENITGGTIRTVGNFTEDRGDFTPTNNTIELYGSYDANLAHAVGSNFHNVIINKTSARREELGTSLQTTDRFGHPVVITRTNIVSAITDLDINGYFDIQNGTFNAPAQMNVAGYWDNDIGPAAFNEGTGLVVFDGSSSVYVYGETFNNLELNKTGTSYIRVTTSNNVECSSFDWTSGKLYVTGGTFTANDLADAGIFGTIQLTSGYINYYQDTGNYVDLRADITISGGEFHVYGGTGEMLWPYAGDASLTMSSGILDIHDSPVHIYSPNTLTSNITGGTIRVAGNFTCERADFNPTGSNTLEMYSTIDAYINMTAGTLNNLNVNKAARSDEENEREPVIFTDRDGNQTEVTRSNTVTLITDVSCDYMVITSGTFNPNGHTLSSTTHFDTHGTVVMNNVNSKIDAELDIYWLTGSIANATLGTFECGGHWYVYSGATMVLPVAVNTYLNPTVNKTILVQQAGTQFGNLYINGSGTVNTVNSSSSEHLVVAGNLYITTGNELDLNLRNLTVNGLLDLDGILDIHGTTASITGKPNLASTSNLSIDSGTFIFYDDSIPRNLNLYGALNINSGTFEAVNNSLVVMSGSINTMVSGNIICDGINATVASTFHPAGGTVTITSNPGSGTYMLNVSGGNWLPNLTIDTNTGVRLNMDVTVDGDLTINDGYINTNGYNLNCAGDVNINDEGTLEIDVAGYLMMQDNSELNVNNGGRLEAIGDPSDTANLATTSGYVDVNIESGGTIAASYAVFFDMSVDGVNVKTGAIVDAGHTFDSCAFGNGEPNGTLLTLNNDQSMAIVNAYFLPNTWSGSSNVKKTGNNGLVNFINASGGYAGENYDLDVYERIFWTTNPVLATPDLQIMKAEWSEPNPDVGEMVTLKVTYLNASTTPASNVFLDLYWNETTPPPLYYYGNQGNNFASVPAGIPQEYTFNVLNTDPGNAGLWNSYFQIDADGLVTESNESNNVFGPFNITWTIVALPAITDLTVHHFSGSTDVILDWGYSTPVDHFNVYCSTDPEFVPDISNLIATVTYPTTSYTDTTVHDYCYYIVTAESGPTARNATNPVDKTSDTVNRLRRTRN